MSSENCEWRVKMIAPPPKVFTQGGAMATSWRRHGVANASPWHRRGGAMATPFRRHGTAMAVSWRLHGVAMEAPCANLYASLRIVNCESRYLDI